MRAFFATNRDKVDGDEVFGHLFQQNPDFFRVGWVDIDDGGLDSDLPPIDPQDVHVAPEVYEYADGQKRYEFSRVGSAEVFPEIVAALRWDATAAAGAPPPTRSPVAGLVFIPGFDYTFIESIGRAAHLAHLYSTDAQKLVPIVFSWPSDGMLTPSAYRSDRRDAEASGVAIARAYAVFLDRLRKLRRPERCGAALHLLAHSMGAYALRNAVATLARPDFSAWPVPIFDTAVIAAGDDDRDTLEREDKMGAIVRIANRIDVYVSRHDKPVRIGDDIGGGEDRLGAYGPIDPTIVNRFAKPLSVVDCENVDVWGLDATRHQYYRLSPTVIADIKAVFAGTPPDQMATRAGRYDSEQLRYILQP